MFAIMKFQQQTNAAAFSHAFVLTIRIFSSSEHSLFDLKYPIVKEADADTIFKDLNVSLDTNEKIISNMISATNKVSPRMDEICQTKNIDQIAKYNAIEDILNNALETTIGSNFQDNNTRESAIFRENQDERIESATTTAEIDLVDKHNIESCNDVQENKSINCYTKRCEKNVEEQYSIDCIQEQSLSVKKMDEIEKAHGLKEEEVTELAVIQKKNQQTQDIQKYKPAGNMKDNEWLLSNKFNIDEKSLEKDDICIINNKNNLSNNREMTSENVINPSNVPHQYFIEKEINSTKSNLIVDESMQKNLQTEIKNIDKDCIPKMIKGNNKSAYTKQEDDYCNEMINLESQENDKQRIRTSMNIDDKQSENNMHSKSYKTRKQKRESERKTVPDKVLRSSNITDLVMEGLMFTIRQDQDSVAVIEQKTKLEMDEVLENSEKVETKAGEKCLLNSSLLRLENLVTMIDSPRSKNEQHKNCHAISNSVNLSSFNVFPSDTVYNVNINDVDAEMNKSNVSNSDKYNGMKHLNPYQSRWQHRRFPSNIKNSDSCLASGIEKYEQLMEWQDSDDEQNKTDKNNIEMEKQEKDFSDTKKINAGLRNTNSLMIEKNIEDNAIRQRCLRRKQNKYDKSIEEHCSSPLSNSSLNPSKTISVISKEPSLIELPRETNVPRIISDKAITIEQMPLALQKVLRRTYRARRFSSMTKYNGMLQQNEQKMQSMALTGDTISEADLLLEDKCIDPNIANSSLSIEFTIDKKKIKSNNEISCVTVDKNGPEMNRDTRLKNSKSKNETRRTLRRRSSSKHGSPRKLQDITEEFYYDLLHVHNKDNAIRQRCLRQKQKSLNDLDDIKSGKVRIEMLKFIQDITEGARVVVRRLNIDNKSNLLEKNSNF